MIPSNPHEHTSGHLGCPACDFARKMILGRILPSSAFTEAAQLWLASRSAQHLGVRGARFLRQNTEKSYAAYVRSLELFFGSLRLEEIHLGHLREYQEARIRGDHPFLRFRRPQDSKPRKLLDGTVLPAKGKTPCPASPKKANQEISILKMIMRRAGCWSDEMGEYYERFAEDGAEVPRALTCEEQKRWLDVAASVPAWSLIYWWSIVAFDTGMSTNELRSLRLGDINLSQGVLSIPAAGAKNKYRQRTIVIASAESQWSISQLLARARDLGANGPFDHLFPFRLKTGGQIFPPVFDVSRSMSSSGIKKPWEEVRKASRLTGFRPYDTRHTAATRWAEVGVAPEVIRARLGHVSDRMMLHYIHIYEAAQRKALAGVPRIGPQPERAPFYVNRSQRLV